MTAWGPGLVRENVTRPGFFACLGSAGACGGGAWLVPADARCQKRQQGNPGREHVRRAVRRDDEPDEWQLAPVDAHVNPIDGSVGGLPMLPPVGFSCA